MPSLSVHVLAPAVAPAEAYRRIGDFARYPELAGAVESVVVHPPGPDGSVLSERAVRLRGGLLKWSERDTFHPLDLAVSFEQVEGDFAEFRGHWRIEADGGGARVRFLAEFDPGVPLLAAILDPVAGSALRGAVLETLRGLLGEVREVAAAPAGGRGRTGRTGSGAAS